MCSLGSQEFKVFGFDLFACLCVHEGQCFTSTVTSFSGWLVKSIWNLLPASSVYCAIPLWPLAHSLKTHVPSLLIPPWGACFWIPSHPTNVLFSSPRTSIAPFQTCLNFIMNYENLMVSLWSNDQCSALISDQHWSVLSVVWLPDCCFYMFVHHLYSCTWCLCPVIYINQFMM